MKMLRLLLLRDDYAESLSRKIQQTAKQANTERIYIQANFERICIHIVCCCDIESTLMNFGLVVVYKRHLTSSTWRVKKKGSDYPLERSVHIRGAKRRL
jgi:hypothetical protein